MSYPLDPHETLDMLSQRAGRNEAAKGFRQDIATASSLDNLLQAFAASPDGEIVVQREAVVELLSDASAALKRNIVGMKIALAHSELSEALSRSRDLTVEELLSGDEKFTRELADGIIRNLNIADLTGGDIGHAVMDVMSANEARPHMHGRRA